MNEFPLVIPKFDREPHNAPGPFYVIKDQCILCALPPETAPDNIKWDAQFQRGGCVGCPNHCRVERQPQTAEELELVIDAACGSCVEAIRYCGTDPQVIAIFRERGPRGFVMLSDGQPNNCVQATPDCVCCEFLRHRPGVPDAER